MNVSNKKNLVIWIWSNRSKYSTICTGKVSTCVFYVTTVLYVFACVITLVQLYFEDCKDGKRRQPDMECGFAGPTETGKKVKSYEYVTGEDCKCEK